MSDTLPANQQRQKGESSKAYSAYIDYRDMGVIRSLRKLHNNYIAPTAPQHCPTKNLSTIENWSSRYSWQDRIKSYEQYLYDQRETLMEKDRYTERQKRTAMLEKFREKIDKQMYMANLQEDGIKAFEALTRAIKTYAELSMKHYNDLPTERKDLTTNDKPFGVTFVTEPVPQSLIEERLAALNLTSFVDEQTD